MRADGGGAPELIEVPAPPDDLIRVRVLNVVSIVPPNRAETVIGSLQQKVMLTLLVASKGRSVSLEALADEVWPEERPQRWRGCLATLASSLRRPVNDRQFIFSTARGYTLHRDPRCVSTDVEALHRCVEQARRALEQGHTDVAETMARMALTIYGTGPWITDYWGWNELAAEGARVLCTALLGRRAFASCIAELSVAIEDFPWHEGLWASLIEAHHQLGNNRRAIELLQKATPAVGAPAPMLAEIARQLAGDADRDGDWPRPDSEGRALRLGDRVRLLPGREGTGAS